MRSVRPPLPRRRDWRLFALTWLTLPLALVAVVLIGAVMMFVLGANPVDGYGALIHGAFGSGPALASTAVKAAPLLLVAVGICIAFRANMFNIGGEGQIAMGGLASATVALALPGLPSPVLIPLVLLAGAAGGAAWGAIPGAFKAYFRVNEILSTIMLNLVAVQLMNYLLGGPLIDKGAGVAGGLIPQTALLSSNAWLPILIGGTRLHLGVPIALLAAVGVYVLLWRTSLGYRIRAVGLSVDAAQYAGMPVKRTMTLAMTLSGAMCGLAGALLVFGSVSHRLVTDGSLTGFTGSAGFNGIVVALFGGLNPLWTTASSFLFGGFVVGGSSLQVRTGVPSDLVTALIGVAVVFIVAIEYTRHQARARSLVVSGPATRERRDVSSGAPRRSIEGPGDA
jgi:ABC-type uncharacterized transport system permease subunit